MDFSAMLAGQDSAQIPEMQQGNFAELLNGGMTPAVPAISPLSMQPQSAGPAPESVNRPAPDPQTGPGILDGARSYLEANPKMAQMLMAAMGTLAGTGSIGKAAQAAALSHFDYDNQQYQRGQKEKELGHKISVDERQLAQGDERIGIQRTEAADNSRLRGAQVDEIAQRTGEAVETGGVRRKALEKKLDLLEVQIRHAETEDKAKKLRMEHEALKLRLDKEYGPQERQQGIAKDQATIAAAGTQAARNVAETESQTLDNNKKRMVNEMLATLSPEEFKAAHIGDKKTGKSKAERFQDYVVRMTAATGKEEADIPGLWKQFEQVDSFGTPGAKKPLTPKEQEQAEFDAKASKLKPGETMVHNGQIYRKPK